MDPENERPQDDVIGGEAAPVDAEKSVQEEALAAFDRGLEEATEAKEAEPVAATEPEQPEPEAAEDAGNPEAAKTESEAAQPEPPKQVEPDPAVEAEIAERGLKGKTADRFRELSERAKLSEPVRAELEKIGATPEQLPAIFKQASDHREWVQTVIDTGATPEQYGMTLEYLTDIGRAGRGDMQAAERAFTKIMEEAQGLATLLGKEVPGIYDPLAAHDDLKSAVENMEITRDMALQVARSRQIEAAGKQAQEGSQQQAQAKQAEAAGIESLNQVDDYLAQNDVDYERKRPILNAMVQNIRQTLPPDKWQQATIQAYQSIPSLPPQGQQQTIARKPPVTSMPSRPAAQAASMRPKSFEDPMAALEFGISQAR